VESGSQRLLKLHQFLLEVFWVLSKTTVIQCWGEINLLIPGSLMYF
jgi:hypothetical protein